MFVGITKSITFISTITASIMNTITTSSIKLQFNNIVEIEPWTILRILGEEFVYSDEDITGYCQVGLVRFGKVDGKIFMSDDREKYFIALEDGRLFSLINLY